LERNHRDRDGNSREEALAIAKRAIRDHGLPRHGEDFSFEKATAWLRMVVQDQLFYHRSNHTKLERAEQGLKSVSFILFCFALAAVVVHFFEHWPALLIFTAFFPAAAAAAHSIATRLDIVHRTQLSEEVAGKLAQIDNSLARLDKSGDATAWAMLRKNALDASKVMSTETDNWHHLVLMQTVVLG
jgi:hypothetical protein